jgi:hypothetical protein
MIRSKTTAVAAVLALITGTISCGGSNSTPTPTTPSVPSFTDVYTGRVAQGETNFGADNSNHFTIHAAGNLTATLTKISPLSTITLGMNLGVYDVASATCQVQLETPSAKLNLVVNASVAVPGEYCVGVYDVGNIGSDPVDYEVTIVHT